MREILFRGKTILHNKWVEGAFSMKDCDSPFGEMVDNPSIIKYEEPYSGFWNRVYPETVGQFTGLTDMNGKKIFEGDIVHVHDCLLRCDAPYHEFDGVIEYKNGSFVIVSEPMTHYRWLDYDVTVLGNIHDNPELLEDG